MMASDLSEPVLHHAPDHRDWGVVGVQRGYLLAL
jgi:hypothetical protein